MSTTQIADNAQWVCLEAVNAIDTTTISIVIVKVKSYILPKEQTAYRFIRYLHYFLSILLYIIHCISPLYSSPELKAEVSFSDRLLSVVCLSFCLFVRLKTFHIFNFFSRTTWPISTKHATKHPWVKKIQVCSNEGSRPFPRGDNTENVKLYWKYLKIFFSRTVWPIWTKLGTKHPWVEGFKFVQMKGHAFFQETIISKI